MNAIIQCYTPAEVERIACGEQTIKVCKTAPKDTPFKVYMYCTNDKHYEIAQIQFSDGLFIKHISENTNWANGCTANIGEILNGKVVGEYVCERITEHEICDSGAVVNYWAEGLQHSCLTISQIDEYVGKRSSADYYKKSKISALHIHAVKFYDKPRELGEFYTICNKYGDDSCGDCPYPAVEQCSFPCDDCVDTWCSVDNIKPITRPPRGWQYVEELDEKF